MRDNGEKRADHLRSALWHLRAAHFAGERVGFVQVLDQIEEAVQAAGAALRGHLAMSAAVEPGASRDLREVSRNCGDRMGCGASLEQVCPRRADRAPGQGVDLGQGGIVKAYPVDQAKPAQELGDADCVAGHVGHDDPVQRAVLIQHPNPAGRTGVGVVGLLFEEGGYVAFFGDGGYALNDLVDQGFFSQDERAALSSALVKLVRYSAKGE